MGEVDLTTLGGRLEYARKNCPQWMLNRRRIVTQSEIASVRGVKRETISAIERNVTKTINAETLEVILALTQVHKDWLLKGDESKAPWLKIPANDPPAAQEEKQNAEGVNLESVSLILAIASQIMSNSHNGVPTDMLVKTLKNAINDL